MASLSITGRTRPPGGPDPAPDRSWELRATAPQLLTSVQKHLGLEELAFAPLKELLGNVIQEAHEVHKDQKRDSGYTYLEGHLFPNAMINLEQLAELDLRDPDEVIVQVIADIWHDMYEDRQENRRKIADLVNEFGTEEVGNYLLRFSEPDKYKRFCNMDPEILSSDISAAPDTYFVLALKLHTWIKDIPGLREKLGVTDDKDSRDFVYECISSAFRAASYPTPKPLAGKDDVPLKLESGPTTFRRQSIGETYPAGQRAKGADVYQNTVSSNAFFKTCNLQTWLANDDVNGDDIKRIGKALRHAYRRSNENGRAFVPIESIGGARRNRKGRLFPVATQEGRFSQQFTQRFYEQDKLLKDSLHEFSRMLLQDLRLRGSESLLVKYELIWQKDHYGHELSLADQLGWFIGQRDPDPSFSTLVQECLEATEDQALSVANKIKAASEKKLS